MIFKIRMLGRRYRNWNNLDHYPNVLVNPYPDGLREAVLTTIGAASMCWSKAPRGVFESDVALSLADELIHYIKEN